MGLCSDCGRPGKLYTCSLCGKAVCSQCTNLKKGICLNCAGGRSDLIHTISAMAGDLRTESK